MAEKSDPTEEPEFRRVLGNLIRTPPKTHAEMKPLVRRRDGEPVEKPTKEKQPGR